MCDIWGIATRWVSQQDYVVPLFRTRLMKLATTVKRKSWCLRCKGGWLQWKSWWHWEELKPGLLREHVIMWYCSKVCFGSCLDVKDQSVLVLLGMISFWTGWMNFCLATTMPPETLNETDFNRRCGCWWVWFLTRGSVLDSPSGSHPRTKSSGPMCLNLYHCSN
jgi:hypothetical protein